MVFKLQRPRFPTLSRKEEPSQGRFQRRLSCKCSPLTTRSYSAHDEHRTTPDLRKVSSTSSRHSVQGTAIRLSHTEQSGNVSESVGQLGVCTDLYLRRQCRGMSSTKIRGSEPCWSQRRHLRQERQRPSAWANGFLLGRSTAKLAQSAPRTKTQLQQGQDLDGIRKIKEHPKIKTERATCINQ